jgi:8-oxo-dGTP pyrophosphatase MutT (NUDIX family)
MAGSSERFKVAVAVYALLLRDGHVLLLRRSGSGFHDGELSLPAGHVEEGEDALSAVVREIEEELLLTVEPSDCTLALTGHSAPERPGDDAYVDLFFTVDRWSGEPRVGEPDKNAGLVWAATTHLPDDTIPYVAEALRAIASGTGPRLLRWHWPAAAD